MRARNAKSIYNETKSKQLRNFCFGGDIPGHVPSGYSRVAAKKYFLQSFKRSRVTTAISVGGRRKAPRPTVFPAFAALPSR